jgi:hypothetical protein
VLQDEEPERPTIAYFRPQHLSASLLANNVQQLVYSGGVLGDIDAGTEYLPVTMQVVEDLLVVSALPRLMPGVLALLGDLDTEAGKSADAAAADTRVTTFQYQLRYASDDAVRLALQPFQNFGGLPNTASEPRITIVEETGTLVVRATAATVAEIRAVIEELDVPAPQVRLTYYLIRGYTAELMDEEGLMPKDMNVGVPADLVSDLSALLPVEGFRMMSFGVLQGDALARREFSDEYGDTSMSLRMYPTTFDRQTGTLGLSQVEFSMSNANVPSNASKGFTTSAQLQPGRYTVLGWVGADPVFVVLQLSRM